MGYIDKSPSMLLLYTSFDEIAESEVSKFSADTMISTKQGLIEETCRGLLLLSLDFMPHESLHRNWRQEWLSLQIPFKQLSSRNKVYS